LEWAREFFDLKSIRCVIVDELAIMIILPLASLAFTIVWLNQMIDRAIKIFI